MIIFELLVSSITIVILSNLIITTNCEKNLMTFQHECRRGPLSEEELLRNNDFLNCWFDSEKSANDTRLKINKIYINKTAESTIPNKRMSTQKDIYIYIHAFQLEKRTEGVSILTIIFDSMISSGLYNKATSIYAVLTGILVLSKLITSPISHCVASQVTSPHQ